MASTSSLRLYLRLRHLSRDHLMALKHSVERGHRFRDLSSSRFGVLETEWIVEAIFRGTDSIPICVARECVGSNRRRSPGRFWGIERGLNGCSAAPAGRRARLMSWLRAIIPPKITREDAVSRRTSNDGTHSTPVSKLSDGLV